MTEYQQFTYPPTPPPHVPPKPKRHVWRWIALAAGALIVVGAVAGALGSGDRRKQRSPAPSGVPAGVRQYPDGTGCVGALLDGQRPAGLADITLASC